MYFLIISPLCVDIPLNIVLLYSFYRSLSSRLISSKTPHTASINNGVIHVIYIYHLVPQGAVKELPPFGQEHCTQAACLFSI